MSKYIDTEKIEYPYMTMSMWGLNSKDCHAYNEGVKAVEDRISALPAADVVSRGVLAQVQWERDVAIDQLNSYGVGFAEKADVVRVKHGRWFLLDDCSNAGVYCSVCHKKVYKEKYANQKLLSKYCPNCGAKMDGETNG